MLPLENTLRWVCSLLVVALVLTLLQTGCRSPRRGEPFAGAVELKTPAARAGQVVFMRSCHPCHPGGEGGLGPALNDKPAPKTLLKLQSRLGLGAMPAFHHEKLSKQELDALAEYLVALRRQPTGAAANPPSPGR